MFGKFLFDGDFSVRNLDVGVELRHYKSSSAFDFSMNKDFSIFHISYILNKELPRVNSVKCAMWAKYGNNMKIEPQHERLPRKLPQGIRPGPRLWQVSDL